MSVGGVAAKFLTVDGGIAAFIVGALVVTSDGRAMGMLLAFFLAGSFATKFHKSRKHALVSDAGLPEAEAGAASDAHTGRTARQVIATGGIPALLCLVSGQSQCP